MPGAMLAFAAQVSMGGSWRCGDQGATLIAIASTLLSAALAIVRDARGAANGLCDGATIFVAIHGVALTCLIWFAAFPFIHLR